MAVDTTRNEVYVADGYLNRRVVVFDSETGAYKRHWGAYGNVPTDDPPELYETGKPLPQQFFIVHGIQLSRDGLLYVSDRQRDRIQVFRRDGTFPRDRVHLPPEGHDAGGLVPGDGAAPHRVGALRGPLHQRRQDAEALPARPPSHEVAGPARAGAARAAPALATG